MIAPSRLAANAELITSTLANRCENTRLARKIGANASAAAARKRGTSGRLSGSSGGTTQVTTSEAISSTYSTQAGGSLICLAVSTARYTDISTPAKTSELTNQVVPNSSANCTTFLVSSSMNAAPMQARAR